MSKLSSSTKIIDNIGTNPQQDKYYTHIREHHFTNVLFSATGVSNPAITVHPASRLSPPAWKADGRQGDEPAEGDFNAILTIRPYGNRQVRRYYPNIPLSNIP